MADQCLHHFFAYAPWALGAAIILVTYVATRGSTAQTPTGQIFACAKCGRRRRREQMVPAAHGGDVSWYCPECSGA